MPVCSSWFQLSADSKYDKVKGRLTLYYLAVTDFLNFVCLKTIIFPGRAYLLNDNYLIRTYKIVNRDALKI